MLELQINLLTAWWAAADMRCNRRLRRPNDDRGEVTATTALIVILVIAAIAAGGVIAAKIATTPTTCPSRRPAGSRSWRGDRHRARWSRVVLLAMLLVVQFGLAYYARTVVAGAAQDGAAAAARQSASPADGVALAESLVERSRRLPARLAHRRRPRPTATPSRSTVTGEVVSLLPFFGTITVRRPARPTSSSSNRKGLDRERRPRHVTEARPASRPRSLSSRC